MALRIISVVVALVLAIAGAIVVSLYVAGADQRALAGAEPVRVIVVAKPVPKGTPVESLGSVIETRPVPRAVLPQGALSTLTEYRGKVTSVDLIPGEVLVGGRLVDPSALLDPGTVALPVGLQEVTFRLTLDRVVGGRLTAGDTVGLFISHDVGNNNPKTHLVRQKVLVTQVSEIPSQGPPSKDSGPDLSSSVLITLALDAPSAEQAVFGAEFGSLWLSHEPATANEQGTRQVDGVEVFK